MAVATHCAEPYRDHGAGEHWGARDGRRRRRARDAEHAALLSPQLTARHLLRATGTCTGADATRWHVRAGGAGSVAVA